MSSDFSPYTTPQTNPYSNADQETYVPPTFIQAYFSFSGRLNRQRYWIYTLGQVGFIIVLLVFIFFLAPAETSVSVAGNNASTSMNAQSQSLLADIYKVIFYIGYITFIWARFALAAKRWHDQGKSGWMNLVQVIPLIGPIWQFIAVGCLPGDSGDNHYGPDPLGPTV